MENNLEAHQDYQKIFCDKIEMIVQTYNSKTAFTYLCDTKDEVLTFNQVKKYLQNRKKGFRNIGLSAGDRVAIIAPHSPYNILTGFALSYSGITAALIDASLPIEEQEKLLSFSDVRAVFTIEKIYRQINLQLYENIPFFDVNSKEQLVPFNKLVKDCILVPETKDPEPDVIAILFSSGTTAQMKGIKVTYKSVLLAKEVFVRLAGLKDYMTYLLVLPFNHIAGFTGAMTYFLTGCELGFIEDVNASKLADGLLRFQPSYFAMVPAVYEVMEQKIRAKFHEKGNTAEKAINLLLKLSGFFRKYFGLNIGRKLFKGITSQVFGENIFGIGTGASPCKKTTAEFFLNLGLEWSNLYATTETNVPITATGVHDRYPADTTGNVNAHPEIQIRICNPDKNGIGEILVKSDLIMKGYFRQPEFTKAAFEDGYFKTGDYGFVDKKGYLHITGRIKESIVLRTGKKISPLDVDEYYSSRMPGVEFASRGIMNEEESYDEIHLFIEDKSYSATEKENISEELNNISRQASTMYKLDNIHFIQQIPKTTVGKVKRFCLEIPMEQKKEPVKRSTNMKKKVNRVYDKKSEEEILFEIIKHITESKINRVYNKKEKLKQDIGLDSLNLFEMCVALHELTGISIEGYLHDNITIGEVLNLLKEDNNIEQIENITKYPLKKTNRIQRHFNIFKKISYHFWDIESSGMEMLDFSQQYIFCPNHESHFDGIWIMSCLPIQVQEKICSMAADYLFEKKIYRFGVEIMGGVPVHRSGNTTLAMNRIYDCLSKEGYSLLIHPEGTRTRDGKLGEFKLGAARLAKQTNIKIVPVHIDGAREIYPPDRKHPKFSKENGQKRKLVIRFGRPIEPTNKSEQDITNEIREYMGENR